MIAGDISFLAINTFPNEIVKKNFPLLPLGKYSFSVVSGN